MMIKGSPASRLVPTVCGGGFIWINEILRAKLAGRGTIFLFFCAIHDAEGCGLAEAFTVRSLDKRWYITVQVEQGTHFGGGFVLAESRAWERCDANERLRDIREDTSVWRRSTID